MDSSSQIDLIEQLADEFAERQQRGERPSIEEYAQRYPELASEIGEVLPALVMMEQVVPVSEDLKESAADERRTVPLETLGDYRILREIGRGGMGIVYEAEQQSLRRRVALKVLPKQNSTDERSLARFQREARAAARMHHTNIVPVFDVGQADEWVFYAMQLIQGQGLDLVIEDLKQIRCEHASLKKTGKKKTKTGSQEGISPAQSIAASLMTGTFRREDLAKDADSSKENSSNSASVPPIASDSEASRGLAETIEQQIGLSTSAVLPGQSEISSAETDRIGYFRGVAKIGFQTAHALAYAHSRGIIHRDIKPSNLLLDAAGTVWVTDFGLAKTGDDGMTHTGDILGTIRYMSPERFRGQCDHRADLYALGLTLYELLVLKPAFSSPDRLRLIEMVTKSEPDIPRSLDPSIPRDLETIVLKCIDKDARHRYQSADELADDLQRFIDDEPIQARRISLAERLARWSRRNKSLAASLMLAAVLLLIINIAGPVMTWRLWRLNADLNVTKNALIIAKDEAVQDRLMAIESRELAVAAQEQLERELYNSDMQGMRVVYQDGNMREARRLLSKYITSGENRDLRGWEWYYWWRATHLESRERWITHRLTEMVVAPDESWIVVKGYDKRVQILNNQNWGIEHGLELESRDLESPQLAVSVDGKLLAGLSTDGRVRLWQTGVWSELEPLQAGSDQTLLSFSKSGLLATGDAQGRVTLWDVQQRSMVGTPLETGQSLRTLSFSPDGNELLTGGRVSEVESAEENTRRGGAPSLLVWHLPNRTTETIDLDESDEAEVVAVRWTPRGTGSDSIIAAALSDGTIRLLSGATFAQLHEVIANGSVETIALSSDGSRLAASTVTTKSVQVWETETAEQISEIRAHSRQIRRLAFSANGKNLLSTATDGSLKSWKIEQARPYFQIEAQDVLSGKSAVELAADHELLSRLRNVNRVRMMSAVSDENQVPPRLGRLGTNGCDENLVYMPVYKRESTNHTSLEIWKTDGAQPVLFHQTNIANPAANSEVTDISICDDGSVVAWSIGGESFVLKVGTRELVRLPSNPDEPFRDLTLSPDGKSLVVWIGRYRRNETWDVSGNQPVKLANLEGWLIRGARFSPDGTQLAQGYSYDEVRVVNSRTGETIHQFVGHAGHVNFVTFSPDGRRLASAGADGVVRLWNLDSSASEQCMLALPGHRDEIDYVAFAPDGNSLLSSSVDGDVRIWPIVDREVNPRLLGERVIHLIEQERFDEARASLERFVDNPWNGRHRNFEMRLGLLHAYLQDREAHENYSRELLTRFASSQSPFDVHCCAKTYLVMPGPHDPQLLEQAIRAGRRCTELGADSYYIDWFECCRGIAELRAGADTEAIKWLRKATDGPFDDVLRPLSFAYQAMAEFRLGHTDEAKSLLHEAEQWTSQTKPAGEHWQNALYCRLAVEEANSVIQPK